MKKIQLLLVALLVISVASCKSLDRSSGLGFNASGGSEAVYAKRFHSTMDSMARQLADKFTDGEPSGTMVVVSTFVPVGGYEISEAFGQLAAERMIAGLSGTGFKVYDMRKAKGILVGEKQGFYSLSNKVRNISNNIRTDLVLAGSYALVGGELMINAMLIRADNSQVVSSATQMLNISDDTFLEPLVSPLLAIHLQSGKRASTGKGRLEIREALFERTDKSSKLLPLKVKRLARDMAANFEDDGSKKSVVITTYVDLDHLNRTNSFGRYVTEQLMEEFSKRGFRVVEVRAAKELFVSPNIGEMALTRNMEDMLNAYKADAIVLGTYQKIGNLVKVNTRMVVADNQEVVSVANMEIKADENDRFMQDLFKNQLEMISHKQSVEGFRK